MANLTGQSWLLAFFAILVTASASAQNPSNPKGSAAVYSQSNGAINPSAVWVDASQFLVGSGPPYDVCLAIQAAIASVPVSGTAAGVVIDARDFVLPSSSPFVLPCSVNPFTITTNPLVLVSGGNSSLTPGSAGGVVLLPGATIAISVPWLVPQSWSVFGQGALVTVLAPGSGFTVPPSGGTVQITSTSVTSSASWGSSANVVGGVLFACPSSSCASASFTNAAVVGILTDFKTNTTFNLGTSAQTTIPSGGFYVIMEPLMAWATTSPRGSTTGGLGNTTGSVIQDIGLDCSLNAGSTTYPTGCLPFYDQYGQERSQLKRIRITNFGSGATPTNPLGIGIYSSTAQNGGPFDDIQMAMVGATAGNICVEVGGVVAGNQPSMRGIRGLTCTAVSGTGAGTGIDINTQNFSLADAHFEDFSFGVEVGDFSSARGIDISGVTGGNGLGTVVDISTHCAMTTGTNCNSVATSDINVSNIYQSTASAVFKDNISGNNPSEATLGFYNLGDGFTSALGVNSRPIVTTSSSVGSSPNFLNMTAGTPITGVQGTGTWVQMSTNVPVTTTNLARFDGSGNTVDSGVAPGSASWSGLTNASSALALANANYATTFDQTSAVNWTWANTTAATVSTTNASPVLNIAANYWTGSASAQDTWTAQSSLASGTNGASTLTFAHAGSSGAADVTFPALTSNSLNQTASLAYAGTCTVSGGTPCTATIGHTYTTPLCIAGAEGTTGSPRTALCSVSGTTVTITGSASGSYAFLVFGNPN